MTLLPRHWIRAKSAGNRTRRTAVRTLLSTVQQTMTAIVFAGGLSLAEYETANGSPSTANSPTVEYTRGPDMGGGVGGLLYSSRSEGILPSPTLKYALSNGRGDIVAQADQNAVLTWTASYEAYGKRTRETGSNADKQRANSKDEDPTGLLNEGFRYRDLETGVWLSRDPAGFVDGPNLYAYVKQNPWTKFDPHGLEAKVTSKKNKDGGTDTTVKVSGVVQYTGKQKEFYMNDANGKMQKLTKEQYLERTKTKMEGDIRKMFDGKEGADSWKIEFDLRIVSSAKDIKRSDHVFNLTDNVAPWPGKAEIGGSIINIFPIITEVPNATTPMHELGHSLGLRHPHPSDVPNGRYGTGFREGTDANNTLRGLKPSNVMGYADDNTPIERSQAQQIQKLYESGQINNYSDKDVADPYYENRTMRQEMMQKLEEIKK